MNNVDDKNFTICMDDTQSCEPLEHMRYLWSFYLKLKFLKYAADGSDPRC
jgi:hypothetical protein